jgi:endonuclease/exonuclease/phosphatase family metal-dependent hydrolase
VHDLSEGDAQVEAVAEIIQRVRPDILLINELDRDPEGRALSLFRDRLARATGDVPGLDYPHAVQPPQNTGVFSGLDLDRDGEAAGPRDAWGYGRFPGQYAMAVLSRWPMRQVRSFSRLRWAEMPGARRPVLPDGTPFHPDDVWERLRLSSKTHLAAEIRLPSGPLWLLAVHATPPVFDGPEDRNGRRNADEIRLLRAILDGADWLEDDAGQGGGLPPGVPVVVAGDLNADPRGGDGIRAAIRALLAHPRLQDPRPASPGAAVAGSPRDGDPALATADWPEPPRGPGNLRADYVLPSADLEVLGAGVFWPAPNGPFARLTGRRGRDLASSDHHLVWVDLAVP